METLTIKLTSPLQSYGSQADFLIRPTDLHPTKSAVLGMIAAALGYDKYSSIDQKKTRELNKLNFAVRVDQPGTLMQDFHSMEYRPNVRKISYRDYLQDAIYVAAIGSDDGQLLKKIEYALHHPTYVLYLGRKADPPAGFLQTKYFKNQNPVEVLQKMTWQASDWYQKRHDSNFKAEIFGDADLLKGKRFKLAKDKVGSFNPDNSYHTYRRVAKTRVELDQNADQENEHDILSIL